MALEVFWASGSTPAWRVLLTLAVKRAPYESRPIRLTRRDQRRPDFLAVNPRGKVPAIRDGAFTLRESVAIMAYLDRRFPDPPLFGETPEETGLVHRFIAEHESTFRPPMLGIVRPILYGGPGTIAGKEDDIRASAALVRDELGALDEALAGRAWLVGGRLTAADLAIYPNVKLVERAAWRTALRGTAGRFGLHVLVPVAVHFPAVAEWCLRVEGLPGYDDTFPPTWRDA
jgi:glutathione S-transferase